jgi:hypothetical protein
VYDEVACPNDVCAPLGGTVVPVVAANDVTGIDFTLQPDPTKAPPTRTIFLNRCALPGCVVTQGNESSINNTSAIAGATRQLSTSLTDAQFDAFAGCVKDLYAPFNAQVVTADPGLVPHQEVMLGSSASQLGQPSSVGGVSPWRCGDIPNAIVFVFTDGSTPQSLCEAAAQELGHSFGLDHEYLCADPMTYLTGCGPKRYQDVDAPCGEGAPRQCVCGSETQNSYRRLLVTLGASPAIFKDGFESSAAAKLTTDDASKLFAPTSCGSVFQLEPAEAGDGGELWRPRNRY